MIKDNHVLDLISYHEMINIIRPKFNATLDEIRYWVKLASKEADIFRCSNNNYLLPYSSDFVIEDTYLRPNEGFFYPEYCFYDRQFVESFIPHPFIRFVYRKDLTGKRNWHDLRVGTTDSVVYKTLCRANECGILRVFNKLTDEFTLYANDTQLWCHIYPEELNAPDSFFLLFEILNIERIFFNKRRDICLAELGDSYIDYPFAENVIKFKPKIKGEQKDDETPF